MIYLVEIPHQTHPKAWSRETKAEVMAVIDQTNARSDVAIYESTTGEELLDVLGYDSINEMRQDNGELAGLADLIDKNGLDATLYKRFDGDYQPQPIDEWAAYIDYLKDDLYMLRVSMSAEDAKNSISNDSWNFHQGIEARTELEKELTNS